MSIEVTPSEASYFNLTRHHLVERLPRGRALEAVGDVGGKEDGVSRALRPRVRVSRRLPISLLFCPLLVNI